MFSLQLKNNGTPLKPRYLQKCMLIILWFRMFPLQLYNNGTPLKPRYLLRYMSIILLFWMMISPEFCHESLALVAGHERCLYQRTLRWELAWRCPALVFTLRPTAPQNKTKMRTILFKLSRQNDSACLKRKQLHSLGTQKWIKTSPVSLQECRQTIVFSGWWKGQLTDFLCVKGRVTPVHSCRQRAWSDSVIIKCT